MKKVSIADFGYNLENIKDAEQKSFMENMLTAVCDVVNKANEGMLTQKDVDAKFDEINGQLKGYDADKFEQLVKDNEQLREMLKKSMDVIEKAHKTPGGMEMLSKFDEKLNAITAAYEEHGGGLEGIAAATWQAIQEASTLGLDILKCKLASMLQQIITAKLLNITNKICAVVMFAFAAYIVVSMVLYQVSPKVREHEQQQGPPSSTQMIKKIHHLHKDENTFSLFHSPRLSGDSSDSGTDSKKHK
jgi:hypothetical protein